MDPASDEDRRVVDRRQLVLVADAAEPTADEPGELLAARPRRATPDRREGDRRVASVDTDGNRRTGTDRRGSARDRRSGSDRRRKPDRRRSTPVAFSREEAGLICQHAAARGSRVQCPRCRGDLTIRPPVVTSGTPVWQVSCSTCHRCVMIRNL